MIENALAEATKERSIPINTIIDVMVYHR